MKKTKEQLLDAAYQPKMHWQTVNRDKVLEAMESYALQFTTPTKESQAIQWNTGKISKDKLPTVKTVERNINVQTILQSELDKIGKGNTTEIQFCYKAIFAAMESYASQVQDDVHFIEMNEDILKRIFKRVSLFDLTECTFVYGIDGKDHWMNAEQGGRVIDSINFDGNLFSMMNNDNSWDYLNPQSSVYTLFNGQKLRFVNDISEPKEAGTDA